jgi:uncharacterized protein YjiS (DUF1127 family)
MKTENLAVSDIAGISQHFGGGLHGEASLDAALVAGGRRGVFRRIAYLWRALLSSYPLAEGDRRTALIIAFIVFEKSRMALWDGQKKRLVSALLKVSKENISDIGRIERLVRYAVEGD